MKKILVLATALLLTSVAYAESPVKEKPSIEQHIEHSKSMVRYYEEMRQYNIDRDKWERECRKLDEKYYNDNIKFQKANAKRLATIKKMNEAKAAIDNAPTREAKSAAYKKYRSLSKEVAKFRLLKAPKYPERSEAPERPKCPGLPELPKRPELPKTN